MPELHILPDTASADHAAAKFVAALAENRSRTHGRFTIALSGGSTPCGLYLLLASSPYAQRMAWDRWHVFWSDERCVPPDHPDSNYRMAKEALLDRVPIPADHVHRMRGEVTPQTAAAEYEQRLRRLFQAAKPVFDLILLGMGEDGHIASLFPDSAALQEESRLVVANWGPHLQAHRITFTLPLINAASTVAFLITDESKAAVLTQVLRPTPGDPLSPAALVHPTSGAVHWFLTTGAASQLERVSA